MPLDPGHVVQVPLLILSGVVIVGLATWVFLRMVRHSLHRGFALVLTVIGLGDLSHAVWHLSEPDPLWRHVQVFFGLLVPFAAINFLLAYRSQMEGASRQRILRAALLALTLALVTFYILRPQAFVGPTGSATYVLKTTLSLGLASLSIVGLALAWDFLHAPDNARRRSLWAMSLGFSLYPWFVSLISLAVGDLISVAPFKRLLGAGLLAPSLGLVALLAYAAFTFRDRETRDLARRYLLALALPLASAGVVAAIFYADARATADQVLAVFVGLWTLTLPGLATYSLFRHQLFGIDLRIRRTIRQGTLAAAFVAVFFLVSEGSQLIFVRLRGNEWVGLGAAALLLFAIHPLQRAAERVATATMPGTKPVESLTSAERVALYREHVTLAWADGALSRKERLDLDEVRARLGLAREEAQRIEDEVVRGR